MKLHIFTNCTYSISHKKTIKETYDSFCNVFGYTAPTIWLDPNPLNNYRELIEYKNYITHNVGSDIRVTKSLSDGYITAINETNSDFCFMLEHDWVFNRQHISHSLDEIVLQMKTDNIHHMKFSMFFNNEITELQNLYRSYDEIKGKYLTYCTTQQASNNPHIVNVNLYKAHALKYIKSDTGSLGIEHMLGNKKDLNLAIYGSFELPPTIKHLDGRNAYS